tara:strand:+ start:5288 stop:5920 length:633 start_codon:yes stop_codon:yes gene_type:complete
MSRKYVGISLRVVLIDKFNEKRDAISQDWTKFLEKFNAYPILIPNTLSNVEDFFSKIQIDILILSGGDNIGEYQERDETERKLIDFAIKKKIPILGVCRGMQILNDYFGGATIVTNNQQHICKSHTVDLINPKFSQIFGNDSLNVNSFHNNIITHEILGENLKPFALCTNDNTIEGFFHKSSSIIGVMWHPERDSNVELELMLMNTLKND